jgi:hypothetical protein
MKYHEFLESHYVSTNIKLQSEYSPFTQAQTQAVQGLINGQRTTLKYVAYVLVLVKYFLMVCRLQKAPQTALELNQAFIAAKNAPKEAPPVVPTVEQTESSEKPA